MTCHMLRDAIVDHARGMAHGPGTSAAVECHLEACEACRALVARQQELSRGLRALAGSVSQEQAPGEVEQRLLAAFADHHARGQRAPLSLNPGWRTSGLAAAAALAVLIGGAVWVLRGPEGDATVRPEVSRTAPSEASRAASANPGPPPALRVPDSQVAGPDGRSSTPPRAGRPGRRAATGNVDDFVAIPAAFGLPAFESGQIVRVDLPVASLPAFGVEIVPDAARSEVQADLLVGQDGHARAIRLVSNEESSRSRR